MNKRIADSPEFGGEWTTKKLNILEDYLNAYTTALKSQLFDLWYIDAFAGTGDIDTSTSDQNEFRLFIEGSAKRAISVKDKPFDRLIFVERDSDRCFHLEKLQRENKSRNIEIKNTDANQYLSNLEGNWNKRRGVLFLDPFSIQVEWATLQKVAAYEALDTWILFPVSTIARMLPQSRSPEDIDVRWASRLTSVFGNASWRGLYKRRLQHDLFDPDAQEREQGIEGILGLYKDRLWELFRDRFLDRSWTLRNSKNSPLFEFLFCAGNPKGAEVAKRIAKHLLKNT